MAYSAFQKNRLVAAEPRLFGNISSRTHPPLINPIVLGMKFITSITSVVLDVDYFNVTSLLKGSPSLSFSLLLSLFLSLPFLLAHFFR